VPEPGGTPARIDGLRIIGLFKILKAVLLLLTTYGIYRMLDPVLVDRLHEWVFSLTDNFERRLLQRGLDWLSSLGHARISGIVVVTALYTAVLLTEGIGLWLRKPWAEWLTALATASLVPFELIELFAGRHGNKLAIFGAFIVNVTIVCYLVLQLRRSRRLRLPAGQP
jgi:uncharacterized membrane protein (DUF2068 family)